MFCLLKTLCFFVLTSLSLQKLYACAACGFGPDETRWAFIATTAILTFVPLVLIAGAVWFLRRKIDKNTSSQNLS